MHAYSTVFVPAKHKQSQRSSVLVKLDISLKESALHILYTLEYPDSHYQLAHPESPRHHSALRHKKGFNNPHFAFWDKFLDVLVVMMVNSHMDHDRKIILP